MIVSWHLLKMPVSAVWPDCSGLTAFFIPAERKCSPLYQALYRKWRPQTFDDVVGQAHITADPEETGADRPALPRLPVHRHPRHRQDHLRQDFGQGGQLRIPHGGQPLWEVSRLLWASTAALF